jgi:hypothetical protein
VRVRRASYEGGLFRCDQPCHRHRNSPAWLCR